MRVLAKSTPVLQNLAYNINSFGGEQSPVPADLMYSQGEETPGCIHQQRSLKTPQRHYPQSTPRLVLNSLHNPVAK